MRNVLPSGNRGCPAVRDLRSLLALLGGICAVFR